MMYKKSVQLLGLFALMTFSDLSCCAGYKNILLGVNGLALIGGYLTYKKYQCDLKEAGPKAIAEVKKKKAYFESMCDKRLNEVWQFTKKTEKLLADVKKEKEQIVKGLQLKDNKDVSQLVKVAQGARDLDLIETMRGLNNSNKELLLRCFDKSGSDEKYNLQCCQKFLVSRKALQTILLGNAIRSNGYNCVLQYTIEKELVRNQCKLLEERIAEANEKI